MIAGQIYF